MISRWNLGVLSLSLLFAANSGCATGREKPLKEPSPAGNVEKEVIKKRPATKAQADPSPAQSKANNRKPTREEYIAAMSASCDSGDSHSCGKLGWAYDNGYFGEPDFQKAEALYSRQCELGNANGCLNLGVLAGNGNLGRIDRERSANLYIRACGMDAAQACGDAAFRLALGDGVAKDMELAIQYGIRGCDIGKAVYACRILGRVYQMNGDTKKAALLMRRACDGKRGEACKELGDLLEKQGSHDEAVKAYERAEKYLEGRCFKRNEPIPCLVLARMISAGRSPSYTIADSIRASKIACKVSPVHCDEKLISGASRKTPSSRK